MPSIDAATVVLVSAYQMLAFGAMGFVFGRNMGRGIYWMAAALTGFGAAILWRIAMGPNRVDVQTVWVDAATVLAGLLLLKGLRKAAQRRGLKLASIAIALAAFSALHVYVVPRYGQTGRIFLMSGTNGVIFLLAGAGLAGQARRCLTPARRPLVLLACLMIGLGAGTWARCIHVAVQQSDKPYADSIALVYYIYLSATIMLLPLGLLWMFFARTHSELERVAGRDSLTNSLNRNGLDEVLRRHYRDRPDPSLVLLQVDVDHFKRINDTWGHETGDRVLRAVSDALHVDLRTNDFVARVGGEEFLIGCVMNDQADGAALAERLRGRVEQLSLLTPDGDPITCTISVGVSRAFRQREDWDAAAREADQALYTAKNAGRNCVRVAAQTIGAAALPATSALA
jgi:diguanylate cyclase (GGDEF)-like protein